MKRNRQLNIRVKASNLPTAKRLKEVVDRQFKYDGWDIALDVEVGETVTESALNDLISQNETRYSADITADPSISAPWE